MSEAIFNINLDRIRHLRDLKDSKNLFVAIPKNSTLRGFGRAPLFLDEKGNLVNRLYNAMIFKSSEVAESFIASDLYTGSKDVIITPLYAYQLEDEVKQIMDANIPNMDFIKYNMTTDEIHYANS